VKLAITRHRLPDQSGHPSIGAHLSILERVGLAEEDLQHSRHGAIVINRQDEEGLGFELPANGRFNPRVGPGILDSQNLASRLVVR
jgi:predicted PhzF superfamily epimerase YddE/YHI9